MPPGPNSIYCVEVGGFFDFFHDASAAEKGRIRIRVR